SLELEPGSLVLLPGAETTPYADVRPFMARTDSVVLAWSSSNPEVVRVDADGTVRALAAGAATVAVEAGGLRAETEVTVEPPVTFSDVSAATFHACALTAAGEAW